MMSDKKRLYFCLDYVDSSSSGNWTFSANLSGVKYYKTGTYSNQRLIGLMDMKGLLNGVKGDVYFFGAYKTYIDSIIYMDSLNYKFDDSFVFY